MKTGYLTILGLGATFMLSGLTVTAAESARVPDTAAARAATRLIGRAELAIKAYVDACVARDAQRMSQVTTRDARIEYTLEDPGAFLSLDASLLNAACATTTPAGNRTARLANFWIFPTNDANTVFVQYDAPGETGKVGSHRQLALVEMRGDQIARMLNFTAMPPEVLASTMRAPGVNNAGSIALDSYCDLLKSTRELQTRH